MHEAARIIRETEPGSITAVNRRFPRDLATIVSTCLQKDCYRWYSSAGELEAALGRFLLGGPFITDPGPIRKILEALGEPFEPPPVSPARGPPTDCDEVVQAHDNRDIFQASPDNLPVIDIHSLWPQPGARCRGSGSGRLGRGLRRREKNAPAGA